MPDVDRINSGENLTDKDLIGVDFAGVVSRPATMVRARLNNAQFDRCTGEQCKHFDFRGASLAGGKFKNKECFGVHLSGVVFSRDTDFTGARMWQHDYDAVDPAEWAKIPLAKRPIVLPSPVPEDEEKIRGKRK